MQKSGFNQTNTINLNEFLYFKNTHPRTAANTNTNACTPRAKLRTTQLQPRPQPFQSHCTIHLIHDSTSQRPSTNLSQWQSHGGIMTQTEDHRLLQLRVKDTKQQHSNAHFCSVSQRPQAHLSFKIAKTFSNYMHILYWILACFRNFVSKIL